MFPDRKVPDANSFKETLFASYRKRRKQGSDHMGYSWVANQTWKVEKRKWRTDTLLHSEMKTWNLGLRLDNLFSQSLRKRLGYDLCWLALALSAPCLEAVSAGAGQCPLHQLRSGWAPRHLPAVTLSSGQRHLWKCRLCNDFSCYWEQADGSLGGMQKGRSAHRMLKRGEGIMTSHETLQQVVLATAASFEGPWLSIAAGELQNGTLFQADSNAVANPQASRIC